MKNLLIQAKKHQFAIAAPNVFNLESIEVSFKAAHHLKAPIILDMEANVGIERLARIIDFYEQEYPAVVFALNLDHGTQFDHIKEAIQHNFTSVMFDGSQLSLSENIRQTKEVVDLAHTKGVSVEAELGHVGQGNSNVDYYTKVDEAILFVEETNIDALAVAIGTTHGLYKGPIQLDFERLQALSSQLNVPLVLHGGSATGDDNLQKCITLGIQKVNLFTDLGNASLDALNELLNGDLHQEIMEKDPEFSQTKRNIVQLINMSFKYGYQQKLEHYIKLFGSNNKDYLF
jgi:fructose-bisphosphate aldolase class II